MSHVVPSLARYSLFCRSWYALIGRTRKDGSKAFTARIVIKKGGAIVHREAETFDRKQAANAWIVKRDLTSTRRGRRTGATTSFNRSMMRDSLR